MLNQSADHALRAVLCLAQPDGRRSKTASSIARATGIPGSYLAKLLPELVHAGVLASVRGPRGGYRLAAPASELTLADVTRPFQKIPRRKTCLLGNRPCDAANPCAAHRQWQHAADQIVSFFSNTSIAAMLSGNGEALERASIRPSDDA